MPILNASRFVLFVICCGFLRKNNNCYNVFFYKHGVIICIYALVSFKVNYPYFMAFLYFITVLFSLCCVVAKVKQLIVSVPYCDLPINKVIYLFHSYHIHICHSNLITLYIITTFTSTHLFLRHCFNNMIHCSCHATF